RRRSRTARMRWRSRSSSRWWRNCAKLRGWCGSGTGDEGEREGGEERQVRKNAREVGGGAAGVADRGGSDCGGDGAARRKVRARGGIDVRMQRARGGDGVGKIGTDWKENFGDAGEYGYAFGVFARGGRAARRFGDVNARRRAAGDFAERRDGGVGGPAGAGEAAGNQVGDDD